MALLCHAKFLAFTHIKYRSNCRLKTIVERSVNLDIAKESDRPKKIVKAIALHLEKQYLIASFQE